MSTTKYLIIIAGAILLTILSLSACQYSDPVGVELDKLSVSPQKINLVGDRPIVAVQ